METVVSGRGKAAAAATVASPEIDQLDDLVTGPAIPIGRLDSVRRRFLALGDLGALVLAYATVWVLLPPVEPVADRIVLASALPVWILLNKLLGLYDRDAHLMHKSTLDELPKIGLSAVLGTTLIFMLAPPVFGFELAREQTALFILLAFLWTASLRGTVRHSVTRRFPPERCLIIGSGTVAGMVARKLAVHPEYGVRLVGFVDVPFDNEPHPVQEAHHADEGNVAHFTPGTDLLGDLDELERICTEEQVDRVVIAFSAISHERLIEAIRTSKQLGLKITVVPRLFEIIGHQVEVDQLEGMTLLGLRGLGRTRSSLLLKRTIDVVGSGLGLLLLAPLMAAIAIAVKLSSRGPLLFVHDRVGRGEAHFPMYKFRTMVDGAESLKPELAHLNEAAGPMFKIADDPRVTSVGRFLRKTSLDELPQLINVLRGDMSLVGPRPLIPSEDVHVIGHHRERLDLTPGLTGPWQVLGRTAIPFEEMIKLDYLYVAEWSLWNDIKLLLRTAPAVLQARGQ